MISLFIAGNLITVAQNKVSAKEKTADSNNVTRKDNQEYNFPEDIIEPGPELPMHLYPPSIEKITNTIINVNIKMYIFDHLRMYIFAILPLDRYIFLSDKIFL